MKLVVVIKLVVTMVMVKLGDNDCDCGDGDSDEIEVGDGAFCGDVGDGTIDSEIDVYRNYDYGEDYNDTSYDYNDVLIID